MITIKEYAVSQKISYEAARQTLNRYKSELKGHIVKRGRTQCLDDYAVDFMKTKRSYSPVVVVQASKEDKINDLENQNKMLLAKVSQLEHQIAETEHQRLIDLKESNNRYCRLQAIITKYQTALQEAEQHLSYFYKTFKHPKMQAESLALEYSDTLKLEAQTSNKADNTENKTE